MTYMKGYDIKVRLDDFKPHTYRDIIIPENITFYQLHLIMQELWNFSNKHLYEFNTTDYKRRYIDFDNHSMEGIYLPDFNEKDAKSEYIKEVFDLTDEIYYTYDFGDSWRFTLEIKKKLDYEENYPEIKEYKGDYGPVENCGGVFILSDMVEYKTNPNFDATDYIKSLSEKLKKFDLNEKNKELMESCTFNNEATPKEEVKIFEESFEKKGFDLYITFNEVIPFTMRNIQIPSGITFNQLHDIIQILVGLDNHHEYRFINLEENICITSNIDENNDYEEVDAENTLVEKYLSKSQYIVYEYDFENTIYLTIEINNCIDYDKNYPTIAEYLGEYNLLDDCGGTTGFMELLQLKENPELADEKEQALINNIKQFNKEEIQDKLIKYCSFKQ